MIYRNTIILYSIGHRVGFSVTFYIIENVHFHFEILGSSVLFFKPILKLLSDVTQLLRIILSSLDIDGFIKKKSLITRGGLYRNIEAKIRYEATKTEFSRGGG